MVITDSMLKQRYLIHFISKLSGSEDVIKLTKEERTKLKYQLEENVKYLDDQMKKSWFIKKWMYRSMVSQYEGILENHFGN